MPALGDTARALRPYANSDDLERFLDVYDVHEDDLTDALSPPVTSLEEQSGTLAELRLHQSRMSTLRRLVICTLLSIPATGRKEDATRWRSSVHEMVKLSTLLGTTSQEIVKLLHDEEREHNLEIEHNFFADIKS